MKLVFFEIEDWEKEYISKNLKISKDLELLFYNEKFDKKLITNDVLGISVFVGSTIDESILEVAPNLKFITTRSTGFDHLKSDLLIEKGVKLGYVPGYGDNTVAEFAFGLLLAVNRHIYEAFDRIKENRDFSIEGLEGFDLKDKTIGIIGTGRIGKEMIKISKGFQMNIMAYDLYPNLELAKELDFRYVSFDELLANSDVISLHIPYTKENHYLINEENISKIKKGAILINTSRGALVDSKALIKGLNEGILRGVGLDVLDGEKETFEERSLVLYGNLQKDDILNILENNVLINTSNVIITPHIAFFTKEAQIRILNTDLANIESFFENFEMKFPIPLLKSN
ncbi:MAG TPA: NAD(P)-dependent oxidoreductase [Candidatus Paceibacterota bacterium]|nr:NAD(P)-dependent oxidoreductase [Candidatus Paceibacterota bacterium]HRS47701.1 NAD(P)-dependent oxidoreductase [Candidatus Paceibacterota bacterium]